MKQAIFNWSGGKDSSIALYYVLKDKTFEIPVLLTSINKKFQRISMHGVRVELLEEQAERLDIPLVKLEIPEMPSMEMYNEIMQDVLDRFKSQGIEHSIFGDIFLEDLRKYREDQLAKIGIQGVFPIWRRSTPELVEEFIDLGFKAITVCVHDKCLDRSFVGRVIDAQFIKDLPKNVDPCGENGEFHSFVYDGPIFNKPIDFEIGEIVYKEYQPSSKEDKEDSEYKCSEDVFSNGFWYCDLIPQDKDAK